MVEAVVIKGMVGEDWADRVILAKDRGPMHEVFAVPAHEEPPEDGSEYARWRIWWWGMFDGKEYGSFIGIGDEVPTVHSEVRVEMLETQACLTMDRLADDAVGATGITVDMMIRCTDQAIPAHYLEELGWLGSSTPEDAVADDSYWLARAMRRLEIEQMLQEIDDGKEESKEEAGC